MVEAILFIVTTGLQLRELPRHLPPFTTVQCYFCGRIRDGHWQSINHFLVMVSREQNCEPSPSAGILDNQSVKTAENSNPSDFDRGKRIKRHIVTDTLGHMVGAVVRPADIQDRNSAPKVAMAIRRLLSRLHHLITNDGYAGKTLRITLALQLRLLFEV